MSAGSQEVDETFEDEKSIGNLYFKEMDCLWDLVIHNVYIYIQLLTLHDIRATDREALAWASTQVKV